MNLIEFFGFEIDLNNRFAKDMIEIIAKKLSINLKELLIVLEHHVPEKDIKKMNLFKDLLKKIIENPNGGYHA